MKTEQKLKNQCTPEFIKWMCKLAEGFEWRNENNVIWIHVPSDIIMVGSKYFSNDSYFPLLIHRAVEGWLKIHDQRFIDIKHKEIQLVHIAYGHVFYEFKNYQPQSLTQAECAMLNCMLDIFKEEK